VRLRRSPGDLVAALLAGAWRPVAAPPALPAREIEPVLRSAEARLLGAGCGPLVWRAVATTDLRSHASAAPYRDAYRHHAVHAEVELRGIAAAVAALREHGIEPLLVKGWATARLYPELGLRPFGDLDLCVRPEEREAAERALALSALAGPIAGPIARVDLHTSLADLAGRSLDELYERGALAALGDPAATRVRVLDAGDHLRLLALHLLRHGAWRPLWLCDVALVVERDGAALDWDLCLRGTRRDARRVACVMGLARRVLGAELPSGLPPEVSRAVRRVPRWLVAATLAQWGRPYTRYTDRPIATSASRPLDLLAAVRRRWPNAIEATMSLDAPFDGLPRLPLQLTDALRRARRALTARRVS